MTYGDLMVGSGSATDNTKVLENFYKNSAEHPALSVDIDGNLEKQPKPDETGPKFFGEATHTSNLLQKAHASSDVNLEIDEDSVSSEIDLHINEVFNFLLSVFFRECYTLLGVSDVIQSNVIHFRKN